MREDESNWFSRWEEQLPSPEELMPLSQTLISPDLALAFDILRNPTTQILTNNSSQTPPPSPSPPNNSTSMAPPIHHNSNNNNSPEFNNNSGDFGSGADDPARTLKRPRLVWTPQLHKRFVDAVAHLGIKNAVPKTIMQLMSVDGLTRENVASHLQKYRLYLKRMQGVSSGGGGNGNGGLVVSSDTAMDHLFASSPVPPHFLRPNADHFLPLVPATAAMQQQQHHHHQQQMAAAVAVAHPQLQQQQQYHRHRPAGHFGSPPNGQFEHPFLTRQSLQQQPMIHRTGAPLHSSMPTAYLQDLESGTLPTGERKVLTLFPTGDD